MNKPGDLIPTFGVLPRIVLPRGMKIERGSLRQRDRLLARAKVLKPVTDAVTLEKTTVVGVEIRRAVKAANEVFGLLKAPLERAIEYLAGLRDKFCTPLLEQQERLEAQVNQFKKAEREQLEEAARVQKQKIDQLANESLQAQSAVNKALKKVTGPKSLAVAEELQRKAAAARQRFMALAGTPVKQMAATRGSATRRSLRYEVVSLAEVFQYNPHLCNLEIKPSAVKAACKPPETATKENPDIGVPGLKLYWEDDTSFRA